MKAYTRDQSLPIARFTTPKFVK